MAEEGGEKGEGEEAQEAGGEAAEGATGGAEINRETTEVSSWVERSIGVRLVKIKCVCGEEVGKVTIIRNIKTLTSQYRW